LQECLLPTVAESDVPKELIAIVDDDESMRDAIEGLMRVLGFPVKTFASPHDFLRSPDFQRTACLVADINMPGMSGVELHQHLVASGMSIPTILITAYPDDNVRTRALRAGVFGYLKKPFVEDDLIACVRSALAQRDPHKRKT
jgi:FixJ family two-component response regulator